MKVLIVNTSERTGGAAVAANRLVDALRNNGVEAKMLVMHKQTTTPFVVQTGSWLHRRWSFVYERVVIWLYNLLSKQNLFKVSIANSGIDITRTPEFQEADIIHLHWVNQGFLSLSDIRKVLGSGKPVVWTMHDMWEATAICHHAYECRRYETACHDCPFLRFPGKHDLSARVFRQKQQILAASPPLGEDGKGPLTFVAVSRWLADCSRRSALIGRFPIKVIPNVISLSHFTIVDRMDARSALSIVGHASQRAEVGHASQRAEVGYASQRAEVGHASQRAELEPWVIAFGAARLDDPIKGFGYLAEALKILTETGRLRRDDVRLLLFGTVRDATIFEQLPVPYTHLGYINDEDRLSLIYSASNVTVSSSLYETFGQTLIEALACGSVPVSFDGSGQADIIIHQKNGYLAQRLSSQSLADGIAWALQSGLSAQELRRSVTSRYSESIVANQYLALYNNL